LKNYLVALTLAGIGAVAASAGTINYNTTGSTLSCNGVSGCTQNTSSQVTVNGITLTYNADAGSGVATPSIINFGNLTATGTGTGVNLTGLLLTILVNSTPPGGSGALPNGAISGTLNTTSSTSSIVFSPNNTTTGFGTLPGVVISGGGKAFTYQVLNTTLGLVPPTPADGITFGQTSIQGAVTDSSAPEPATLVLIGLGLGTVAMLKRRQA
jgi:hypothetical protein